MADQNFTQFSEDISPDTGDYVVGHNAEGTAEFRALITNLPFLKISDSGNIGGVNGWNETYSGHIEEYSLQKSDSGNLLDKVNSGHIVEQIGGASWGEIPSGHLEEYSDAYVATASGHLDEYGLHKSDSGNFLTLADSGNLEEIGWNETLSGHVLENTLLTSDSGNFLSKWHSGELLNIQSSGHLEEYSDAYVATASGHLDEYSLHKSDSGNFLTLADSGNLEEIGWNETYSGHIEEYSLQKTDSGNFLTDFSTDTLTNKTFDANGTGNSISNIDVEDLSNGTDGELITWDAAGAPTTVTVGNATEVLTSNGSGSPPTFQPVSQVTTQQTFHFALGAEDVDLETGTAALTFRAPYACTVKEVRASVTTAPTGAAIQVDINESGVSILSTKLTIDATEKTSETAATAAVISDTAIADDAEITVDIDQVGSTIAGQGLKIAIVVDATLYAIAVSLSDEGEDLATGTGVTTFRMPYGMNLTEVRASVDTAPTGAALIFDINEGGSTIMTTNKVQIDATEKTSTTAATLPTLTDTVLADDAEITIDVDQVGSTVAGAGGKIYLIGTKA